MLQDNPLSRAHGKEEHDGDSRRTTTIHPLAVLALYDPLVSRVAKLAGWGVNPVTVRAVLLVAPPTAVGRIDGAPCWAYCTHAHVTARKMRKRGEFFFPQILLPRRRHNAVTGQLDTPG